MIPGDVSYLRWLVQLPANNEQKEGQWPTAKFLEGRTKLQTTHRARALALTLKTNPNPAGFVLL